jgi:hypothetical protein
MHAQNSAVFRRRARTELGAKGVAHPDFSGATRTSVYIPRRFSSVLRRYLNLVHSQDIRPAPPGARRELYSTKFSTKLSTGSRSRGYQNSAAQNLALNLARAYMGTRARCVCTATSIFFKKIPAQLATVELSGGEPAHRARAAPARAGFRILPGRKPMHRAHSLIGILGKRCTE